MPTETTLDDDPIIRLVAAARPHVAEDDLSPHSPQARALAERILAGSTSAGAPARRRRWARPQWMLPRVGLVLAPIAAVIVLLLAGTFSGPDDSGTRPAAAAVIRAAVHALTSSGGIFVDDETYVSGPTVHGHPYSIDQIFEIPKGPGGESVLTSYSDPGQLHQNPAQTGWTYGNGQQAIYSRATNTIYQTSIWGPYLHPGRRPGTYVYRPAKGAVIATGHPVTVTARQARALLAGRVAIVPVNDTGRVAIKNPGNRPGYAQVMRQELRAHMLHYVGRTTVDGRAAFELAGETGFGKSSYEHIYLDPTTHLPFEEIDQPGTAHQQVIKVHLRNLPITRANERLLSLQALHPSARVDHSLRDYLRAAGNTQIYTG